MKAGFPIVHPARLMMAVFLVAGGLAQTASAAPRPQKQIPEKPKKLVAVAPNPPTPPASTGDVQADPEGMDSTRRTFMELLDRYPRLNNTISRDPSLLNNQEYITSNAPGLWEFLQKHPEIARDPEFFLAGRLKRQGFNDQYPPDPVSMRILNDVWPFLVFVIIMGSLLWILRSILENRRWTRLAKVQAEAHTKLLERFGSSQELLAYISTEPGKKFLESAPIAVDIEAGPKLNAPLSRILWSVQLGLILALGGIGLLYVRSSVPDADEPLLLFGTLGLTFGVGFILSAVFSYGLSRHLGLFEKDGNSARSPLSLGTGGDSKS